MVRHVEGPAKLIVIGTPNPLSEEPYVGDTRRAFEGRLMAIIHADGEASTVTVRASAEGVKEGMVELKVR